MQSTVVDDRNVVLACTSSCTRLAIWAFSNGLFGRASVELVLKAIPFDLATCSVLRNVFDAKESPILKVCFQSDRL